MPKEIFPSSFECDCGHQSDFFENTVREMKAMSQKKKVYLADSAPEEHTIVFYRGKLVEIQCPKQAQSHKTKQSTPQSKPSTKRTTTRGIPDAVKMDVATIVEHFNTTAIRNPLCVYVPRYKGKFHIPPNLVVTPRHLPILLQLRRHSPMLGHQPHQLSDLRMTHAPHHSPDP